MGLIQKIKNFFRKGANVISAQGSLQSILDHDRITTDPKEVTRIRDSLKYYSGDYGKLTFRNSFGDVTDREFATVNMAKKVANEYAKVIFNEQVEIAVGTVGKDGNRDVNNETNAWVQHVLEHNDFKKNFSEYLEAGLALGGLAIRPYFDQTTGEIEFSWALADAFFPLESNTNNISEGALTFKTTRAEGNKTFYFTLLEIHEWDDELYVITNELYQSEDPEVIGKQVPLEKLYPNMIERAEIRTLKRPLFNYLKIAGFNNLNPGNPLGLGVFDNAKGSLDRINRAIDAFDREIVLGKRRIAAPETMLKGIVNQKTGEIKQVLDPDEDIYQIIPGSGDIDEFNVKDLTFDIRTEQYIATINQHIRILEMETGLSTGTFTFDGNSIRQTKTATEVVSERSQTYQSRNMQITQVEKFIKELIINICELGRITNGKSGSIFKGETPSEEEIGIDFDDGIFIDKESQKKYYTELGNAGYLPKWYVTAKLLNLPEDKARALQEEASRDIGRTAAGDINLPEELE